MNWARLAITRVIIDTTATVTMEDIAALWTMTQIHLDVVATVPKVAQCDFVDAALRAKANCPISRSLNANISMRATLSPRGAAGPGIFRKREGEMAPRTKSGLPKGGCFL